MSIGFWTRDESAGLNLSNVNACELLRRLWPELRNTDPAIPGSVHGGTIDAGRPAGYLRDRTARLLAIAEDAPEGIVQFG